MGDQLTHMDDQGRAHMVDVGGKAITEREAVAVGCVEMKAQTLSTILSGGASKGDVLAVARLAGIMGAKRTGDLIPLCHPLPLTHVGVEFAPEPGQDKGKLWIRATSRCVGRTGVEMEAMTAVSTAALTVYDMCKAIDKAMVVRQVALWTKRGGRSGDFEHPQAAAPDALAWQ